jgi:type II secretory pathway component PulM
VTNRAADVRATALNAYIAQRGAQGFRVETRSGLQAVIVRRRPLYFLLRWLPRLAAEERLVVSVDENAEVATLAAQPHRW